MACSFSRGEIGVSSWWERRVRLKYQVQPIEAAIRGRGGGDTGSGGESQKCCRGLGEGLERRGRKGGVSEARVLPTWHRGMSARFLRGRGWVQRPKSGNKGDQETWIRGEAGKTSPLEEGQPRRSRNRTLRLTVMWVAESNQVRIPDLALLLLFLINKLDKLLATDSEPVVGVNNNWSKMRSKNSNFVRTLWDRGEQ